jgi:DNA-3-methyladenine glycosylase
VGTNSARRRGILPGRRGSSRTPLPGSFYARETEIVARELLGATLICESDEGLASGRIVETEAYLGEHDLACHAAAGRTARTDPLYGPPGIAYVYFIYGVHWCVNAVTRPEGQPSAVLIRALEPIEGLSLMRRRRRAPRRDLDLTNGPGKLCQALGITGAHNRLPLDRSPLRILRGTPVADAEVAITPRIGITQCADWPLRWVIAGNPYVSRGAPPRPRLRP